MIDAFSVLQRSTQQPEGPDWFTIGIIGGAIVLFLIFLGLLIWFIAARKRKRSPKVTKIPTQVAVPNHAATAQNNAQQVYGLQFILDSGETRVFESLPISIGRGDENDLILNDETVSNNHACVYYDKLARAICITDYGSLNGLFVEDFPTTKNVLWDGARIRVGNVQLIFRDMGYLHSEVR